MALSRDQKCELLKKNLCFENFFNVLCMEPEAVAEIWLEKDREQKMTFEEFRTRVMQAAARIQDAALGRPDGWVGLWLETQVDWPILFWALLAAGRKPLLLDPTLKDEAVRHLMTQAGATALILARHRDGLAEYSQRTVQELTEGVFSKGFTPQWADRMALCTSGTTATSRVYVYDGRAVCLQSIAFVEQQKRRCMTHEKFGRQRMLCFLPLNHVFGMMTNLFPGMLEGNPQVFLHDRAPETILKTCRLCKVDFVLAVPMLVNGISSNLQKKLAAQPPHKRAAFRTLQKISLFTQRIWPEGGLWLARNVLFKSINAQLFGPTVVQIALGGANAPYEHLRTMATLGYNTSFGYGMTETAVTAYDGDMDLKARLSGCSGQLLPIAQAKVTDAGELIIGCDAIHIGQLRDGKLTPPDLDEKGMFHTGDLVRFDQKNRLHIEGRVKDVIIGSSGENIYPDEIENTFTGMDGVEMMTVLGTGDKGREQVTLVLSLGDKLYDGAVRSAVKQQVEERNRTLPQAKQARVILATAEKLPHQGGPGGGPRAHPGRYRKEGSLLLRRGPGHRGAHPAHRPLYQRSGRGQPANAVRDAQNRGDLRRAAGRGGHRPVHLRPGRGQRGARPAARRSARPPYRERPRQGEAHHPGGGYAGIPGPANPPQEPAGRKPLLCGS